MFSRRSSHSSDKSTSASVSHVRSRQRLCPRHKEIRKRIENKAELRKKKLKEEAERKAREAKQKAIVEAAAKKAAGQKKTEMFADSGSGGWGGAEMFAGKLPVAPGPSLYKRQTGWPLGGATLALMLVKMPQNFFHIK